MAKHPYRDAYIPPVPPGAADDVSQAIERHTAMSAFSLSDITTRDLQYTKLVEWDDGSVIRVYRYDPNNTAAEDGVTVILDAMARAFVLVGSIPNTGIPATANGATISFAMAEEELTGLAGASVDTTIVIPDRAIVLGVSTRTTLAIAGATSYDTGTAAEIAKFGGSLGIALNATNSGVIAPTAYYTATPVRLTANGGNFTAGSVRVTIHYMLCGPAVS